MTTNDNAELLTRDRLPGLEGPFRFPSGRVLYYDPREGAYYDRGSDIYLDRTEVPQ